MIFKDQKVYGPDGQGYEIVEDIPFGSSLHVSQFKPFGGAPEPRPGMKMPEWLVMALEMRAKAENFRVSRFG